MPRGKIMQAPVQVKTKIDAMTGLLVGTVVICSIAVISVFGLQFAAAVANLSGQNNPPIPFEAGQCSDADNYTTMLDDSLIYPYAGFKTTYGSVAMVQNFDPFKAGKAVCRDSVKVVGYVDQCYIDKYGPLGYIGSVQVNSCAPTDKRCRVRDGFVYPMNTTTSSSTKFAVGSWNYLCKNGCVAGACLKDPEPVCVDSDIKSDGGDDPFMQGYISGWDNGGRMISDTDYCVASENSLIPVLSGPMVREYGCFNNRVQDGVIICANGCAKGACKRYNDFGPLVIVNSPKERLKSGNIKIAEVTITAKGHDIIINKIPLDLMLSSGVSILNTTIKVKKGSMTLPTNNTPINFVPLSDGYKGGATVVNFSNLTIRKNQTVNLDVYISVSSIVPSVRNSIATSICPSGKFVWGDSTVGVNNLTDSSISQFPLCMQVGVWSK